MFVKIVEISVYEEKFFLGDGFEHVFIIVAEKEEFSAPSSLSLDQIKHFFAIIMQLKGQKNILKSVIFQELLKYLRCMNNHIAL